MYRTSTRLVRMALGLAASVCIGGGWADLTTGPISPYYLNNAQDQTIYVVQGTSVVNSSSWSYDPGCSNYCEANLAITNGYIATNWVGNDPLWIGSNYTPGVAGQYTLNGTPTGVSWTNSPPPPSTTSIGFLDGTSNGTHIFTVEHHATPAPTHVVSYDLQWQNPTPLFEVPFFKIGTTYDPVDNALWLSGDGDSTISEHSLTGTLLSSFTTVVPRMTALAYDAADDTLWFSDWSTGLLYQYSKTGVLLQSGVPAGLPAACPSLPAAGCFVAGKIAGAIVSTVPEPASLALLGTGLAGLWFAVRRRNRLPA